jgi:hypothetical protein
MTNTDSTDDFKVGYKRPPRHSQFRPGQSGNSRGREGESEIFGLTSRQRWRARSCSTRAGRQNGYRPRKLCCSG